MSRFRHTNSFLLSIVSILAFPSHCFGASDRITAPIVSSEMVRLASGVPLKAQSQFDRGPVDPSLKLSYMTLLAVPSTGQRKAIDRLLAGQQDPQSPLYHKWLTPARYAERFGLGSNDIRKIVLWLESQGFTVLDVAHARDFVVFSGTAGQVESAFVTPIHKFQVDGELHFSNTAPPSIPAALSGIVMGVRGLSNFRPKSQAVHSRPGYTLPVTGGNAYFLAPGDIATIYDIGPLYSAGVDGTGQTLAVMGQTDVYFADLDDFRNYFGLQRFTCTSNSSDVITACSATNFKYVLVNSDPGTPSTDDLAEADIDIEWSGAVARNAQIVYVNAPDPNGNGVWDAWYYAVDNNVSPVITMSYGQCELMEAEDGSSGEGTFSSDEAELKQANSEGITFMNSSGDDGAAECDYQSNYPTGGYAVSYPASSPEVTGVGGTLIPYTNYIGTYWSSSNHANGGSALQYIPEDGWNDAQEWSEYCTAFPSDSTCTSNPGLSSWATAQETYIGVVAGGGGLSNCVTEAGGVCATPPGGGFPQPNWQSGLVVPGQSTAVRFSPDVSLLASVYWPGYIVCTPIEEVESGSNDTTSVCANGIANDLNTYQATFGGTSIPTPIFAGIVTLINHYLVKNGVGAAGLGNINPNLYKMAAASPDAFHKITSGSNGVYCQAGTPANQPSALQCPSNGFLGFDASNYDTNTGYNLVSGLGSVDANNLATNWSGSPGASDYSISANPASVTVLAGQSGTSTITVSATNGFSGTVNLSCSVSSSTAKMGCSLSPSSVSLSSTSTSATATLTVTTTSSSARIGTAASESHDRTNWLQGSLRLLACVGLFGFPRRARYRRSGLSLLLLSILAFSVSCGGGGGSGGTPQGSYTATVTGTSGSQTHTATVSVSVQ
jgi:subtilase family serine protease